MEIIFSPQSLEDLQYWKQTGNKKIQSKIQKLIDSIKQTPYDVVLENLKHSNIIGLVIGQGVLIMNIGLFTNGKMKE